MIKTKKIDYALLGKRVAEQYPWLIDKLILQPDIDNLQLLPEVFESFVEIYPIELTKINKKKLFEFRILFIALAIRLFDPEMLSGDKAQMRHKLREGISSVLKMQPPQISYNFKIVTTYYKHNKEFVIRVNYFYKVLKKNFIK